MKGSGIRRTLLSHIPSVPRGFKSAICAELLGIGVYTHCFKKTALASRLTIRLTVELFLLCVNVTNNLIVSQDKVTRINLKIAFEGLL